MSWIKRTPAWAEKEEVKAPAMNNLEAGFESLLGAKGIVGFTPQEFGALGNGVHNDGPALNECFLAAKERAVVIPPGIYITEEALKVPELSHIIGLNKLTTSLRAKGEFNLLEVTGGGVTIESLELESSTAQTLKGSAVDLSHGFGTELQLRNLMIGSNFFNGLFLVGNKEIGAIACDRIHFVASAGAVKSYHNAGIVIGSSAQRAVMVQLTNIHGQAATAADMPIWMEVNNTDTLQMSNVLLQTGTKGLVVGNNDASTKRSTNLYASAVVADGCTAGFELSSLFSAEFGGCHAEACGNGIILGTTLSGVDFYGGSAYHCEADGIKLLGSSAPTNSITLSGMTIADNGENKEAGRAGINIAEKAGGLLVTGCTIGNPGLVGGGEQKVGVLVGKKAENVLVNGNRIMKNGAANVKKEGEEVGVTATNNLEL